MQTTRYGERFSVTIFVAASNPNAGRRCGVAAGWLTASAAEGQKQTPRPLALADIRSEWPSFLGANNAFSETSGVKLIEVKTAASLPYYDRLVNLLVADLDALGDDAPSKEEINRVLGYEGVAYLKQDGKWTKTAKPTPKNVDAWTHYHYDASGNPVSKDLVVGPPNTFRWVDGPFGMNLIGGLRTSDGVSVQINPAYLPMKSRPRVPADPKGSLVYPQTLVPPQLNHQ
jgi:hypothetical protein